MRAVASTLARCARTTPNVVSRAFAGAVRANEETRRPGANGRVPVVHHTSYSKPVMPPNHRFPMSVFQRVYDVCRSEGIVDGSNVFVPARTPTMDELCAAHDETYARAVCSSALSEKATREIGLPWSDDLVKLPAILGGGITGLLKMAPVFRTTASDVIDIFKGEGDDASRKDYVKDRKSVV